MHVIDRFPKVVSGTKPNDLNDAYLTSLEPILFKGLISNWPLVKAAERSMYDADQYIRGFYNGVTVIGSYGAPEILGRIFYDEAMTGLNFESAGVRLDFVLDQIMRHRDDSLPPLFYVGSTTVDACLPRFRLENDLDLLGRDPLVSLWLGNRSRIAAHYDLPDNLACNAVGRRRFTLFPPDQLDNLYVGPIDFTPAGQPISLVDFQIPDFDRFPKFREALDHAYMAELEPGDALFIPSMWWHHVEGLDSLNILINYWWRQSPSYMGPPIDALRYAFLTIRDLPKEQRSAWEHLFDHYIFHPDANVVDHIPVEARGILAGTDENMSRQIRSLLINRLKC